MEVTAVSTFLTPSGRVLIASSVFGGTTSSTVHPTLPSTAHLALQRQRLAKLRDTLDRMLEGKAFITLEIGSGHGHYLTAYASAHPSRFCLGIDIMSDRLLRSDRKRQRAGLTNLAFIQASADDLLAALPGNVLLEDIFVLFPDPWPKRRHCKNRLIQSEFLTQLAPRCAPGARLYFRTDFIPYFEAAFQIVTAHDLWNVQTSTAWPFELATVFQSRAETFQSLIALRE